MAHLYHEQDRSAVGELYFLRAPAWLTSSPPPSSAGGSSPYGAGGTAPPLLLPLLLQGAEKMARAVDLVLMLADGLGGAVRPAALLGGFKVGQAPGLRFALHM